MPVVVAAEDDADIAELLGDVLRNAGYTFYGASDGEQAMLLIEQHRPDLVILDHHMPGVTGLEVAQALRADPRTVDVPLLMISGDAPGEAGIVFDDVLAKPLRPRVLKAHVESLLAAARAEPDRDPSPLLDRRRLGALAGYDWDDPELRRSLDAIAERTARRLGLPTGMVNLVLDTAQFMVGSYGVTGVMAEAGGAPIEWSFCARTVTTGQPYVVPDATADPERRDNPLVRMDGLTSYAGVPLIDENGQVFGAHCVSGPGAHTFTEADLAELRAAAEEMMALCRRYRLS